jgi:DnaJ-class molecular chaperone
MATLTTCPRCGGTGQQSDYGIGDDFYGAKECGHCKGSGSVQLRDDRGRFTKSKNVT